MTTYVLYHGNCFDGTGAAWAVRRAIGEDGVFYFPVFYGQDPPSMTPESRIIIVDFSYPRDVLRTLVSWHEEVTVLDHHKTARDDLAPLLENGEIRGEFDLSRSGATMAWDWFHGHTTRPRLIEYLEDRDLWRFRLPASRHASAVIKSYPFALDAYDELHARFERGFETVVAEGVAMTRLIDQQVATMCDQVTNADFSGTTASVPIVNATVFFSEVGEELLKRFPEAEVVAYYFDRADGRRQWGLRSRPGFDCSVIAKHLGGGGHPQASGFTTERGWMP